MKNRLFSFSKFIRIFHKYLNLLISFQLLLWTISGLYFSYNKKNLDNSKYFNASEDQIFYIQEQKKLIPSKEIKYLYRNEKIIILNKNSQGTKYFFQNGNEVTKLNFEESEKILESKTNLVSINVEEITKHTKGSEYRGKKLPLYKISSISPEGKNVNAYMNPYSGEIIALRTNVWRVWDLLWGFHIMDWSEREKINNFFLKFFSILALLSSISGLLLFFNFKVKKNHKTR